MRRPTDGLSPLDSRAKDTSLRLDKPAVSGLESVRRRAGLEGKDINNGTTSVTFYVQ